MSKTVSVNRRLARGLCVAGWLLAGAAASGADAVLLRATQFQTYTGKYALGYRTLPAGTTVDVSDERSGGLVKVYAEKGTLVAFLPADRFSLKPAAAPAPPAPATPAPPAEAEKPPGAADWQKKAVADYPDLARKDSFLNRAFVKAYKDLSEHYAELSKSPRAVYDLAAALKQADDGATPLETVDDVATKAVARLLNARLAGGFLGVPWGATRAQAQGTVTARGNATLNNVSEVDENLLVFDGGDYAGVETKTLTLEFTGGRFYRAMAHVDTKGDDDRAKWQRVIQGLTNKYGPASEIGKEKSLRDEPTLWYRWHLPTARQETESIACCENPARTEIIVYYMNETLQKEHLARFEKDEAAKEQRALKDF